MPLSYFLGVPEEFMIGDFDMKLITKLIKEYERAKKKKKSAILTEYCKLTGSGRDAAIKRFSRYIKPFLKTGNIKPSVNGKGPKRKYGIIHKEIVMKCWELAGKVCAEKIHPMIDIYLWQLKQNKRLDFYSAEEIAQTKKISLGSLKRIIAIFPKASSKKHKGNASIYKEIPMMADFGKFALKKPGYIEVDFVEHNGGNSSGRFAITGTYTDVFSQWTNRAANLGKNFESMKNIDDMVHKRFFHPALHYHPDNDKTILKLLFEMMKNGKRGAFKLSRSRPYKKNDNAHVEQKNDDKVRKLVGYWRYDTEEEIYLLNQLYEKADYYDNFFIATAKLKKKIRNSKGRVIKRVYYKPETPYQRLMASKHVPKAIKRELKEIYSKLNMVKLREEMEEILSKLWRIICEKNGQKQKRFHGQNLLSNKTIKKAISRTFN